MRADVGVCADRLTIIQRPLLKALLQEAQVHSRHVAAQDPGPWVRPVRCLPRRPQQGHVRSRVRLRMPIFGQIGLVSRNPPLHAILVPLDDMKHEVLPLRHVLRRIALLFQALFHLPSPRPGRLRLLPDEGWHQFDAIFVCPRHDTVVFVPDETVILRLNLRPLEGHTQAMPARIQQVVT